MPKIPPVERNPDGSPDCSDVDIKGQQHDYVTPVHPQPPRHNMDIEDKPGGY
jgi:hypothetical protein